MTTASPVWLLDLVVDGRLERFATRGSVIATELGEDVAYREGLSEVALDLVAEVAGGEISTAISISADWLEGIEVGAAGWSRLVAAWHSLEGASAVLRRWFPGMTLERARVMLRGVVEEVEHGGRAEPLQFTLRRNLFAGSRPLLDPLARVDLETWPISAGAGIVLDVKSLGAYYPRVFGFPGDDSISPYVPGIPRAAVPAILAQTRGNPGTGNYLVIADREIGADEVRLYDYSEDPPTADTFPVQLVEDNLGRLVAVSIANPTPMDPELGHAFYAGFSTDAAFGGGGELRPDKSGELRGLGEIVEYLLDRHTRADVLEVDQRLDGWLLDTWINEGNLDAWDWITRELAPICPFRLFEGRLGLPVRLFDWLAHPRDAVARFDVELGQIERASGIRSRPASGVANRIVIEWKRDRATDSYVERYTLDATADPDDQRAGGSLRAAISQRRFADPATGDDGVRELVVQTPHVWDPAVAPLVARYLMAELALPPSEVTYRGEVGLEQRIDPCDPIIINDPEVGFVNRLALVSRLTPRPSDTLVALVVLDDPTTVERPPL